MTKPRKSGFVWLWLAMSVGWAITPPYDALDTIKVIYVMGWAMLAAYWWMRLEMFE